MTWGVNRVKGVTGQKEEKKEKDKMEKKKRTENCCGQDGTGRTDGIEGSIRGPRQPKNARSCVKLAPLRASVNLATLSLFC